MAKRKAQPTSTPTIRPALYLRVSTEEQAIEGFGLKDQRSRTMAMATVKGWPAPVAFVDDGVSGTLTPAEREGMTSLLDAIERGEVNVVIVAALDRLGRKTRIILDLVDQLDAAGVELVSCKESLDTSTPAGRFVLTIFAALAQLDRDNIVDRTTGGRNARGKVDGERGGSVPYGYRRLRDDKGKAIGVAIDRSEAAIVRAVFRLRDKRDRRGRRHTIAAIAAALPGTAPGGGAWQVSTVAAILAKRDIYRGGRRGASAVQWPPILTEREHTT